LVLLPAITRTASWAVGDPEHVAVMEAQDGIDTALGVGDGDGEGVGLGLGDGEGDGVGDGLWMTEALGVLPHAASAMAATSASTPTLRLTGKTNGEAGMGVTDRRPWATGAQGYSKQGGVATNLPA
jgi:hypothetical protein